MAVTEIHPITTSLNRAIEYIENPSKTDEKMLCTGFACTPQTACGEFEKIRKLCFKLRVLCKHKTSKIGGILICQHLQLQKRILKQKL